jgi:hypothetical protein
VARSVRDEAGDADAEPYLTAAFDDQPKWISGSWALAAAAELLLLDSQYTEDEYPRRLGWGHSSVTHSGAFARAAGVRRLAMFRHDPDPMRSDGEPEWLYDRAATIVHDNQEPPLIAGDGLAITLGMDSRATHNPGDGDDRP